MNRKFASDFESLTNQSAVQNGAWADLDGCSQMDYGVNQVTGASGGISDGTLILESCNDLNSPPFLVLSIDETTLNQLGVRGWQGSEARPHGRYVRWAIGEALVGGTVTATINGQLPS